MTETTTFPARKYGIEESIRGWANVLCLWRFCRQKKCMRASACCGSDVRRCFHAHYILLPDNVQLWWEALGEAKDEGLSWEQAMDRLAEEDLDGRLEEWQRTIEYSRNVLLNKEGPWAEGQR